MTLYKNLFYDVHMCVLKHIPHSFTLICPCLHGQTFHPDNVSSISLFYAHLFLASSTLTAYTHLSSQLLSSSSWFLRPHVMPALIWLIRVSIPAWLGKNSPSPKQEGDVAQQNNTECLHHCLLAGIWSKNFTLDVLLVIILSLLALSSTWNSWNTVSLLQSPTLGTSFTPILSCLHG